MKTSNKKSYGPWDIVKGIVAVIAIILVAISELFGYVVKIPTIWWLIGLIATSGTAICVFVILNPE